MFFVLTYPCLGFFSFFFSDALDVATKKDTPDVLGPFRDY